MSRLSKLEAVNLVLSASGKVPVNTIDAPTTVDASLALRLVDAVHREVLSQSWHWNTEYLVSLEVDTLTGTIPVPSSILRASVEDSPWIIHRGDRLYDRSTKSYTFDEAVMATVIHYLVWDDLPEEARAYIQAVAAVRYYAAFAGTDSGLDILRSQAFIAEAALREQDADVGNYSIFDSPDIASGLPHYPNPYLPGTARNGRSLSDDRTPQ